MCPGPVKAPLLGSGFHTSVGKESRAQTLQGGEHLHHLLHSSAAELLDSFDLGCVFRKASDSTSGQSAAAEPALFGHGLQLLQDGGQ